MEVQPLGVLTPEPTTPGEARRLVRGLLEGLTDGEVLDAVLLAVSELVTNAVEHAGTRIELRAGVDDECIRVEVADGSGDLPRRKQPTPDAIGGRGLHLLEQLADRWSVDTTPAGKTVWFERRLNGGAKVPPWPSTPT